MEVYNKHNLDKALLLATFDRLNSHEEFTLGHPTLVRMFLMGVSSQKWFQTLSGEDIIRFGEKASHMLLNAIEKC